MYYLQWDLTGRLQALWGYLVRASEEFGKLSPLNQVLVVATLIAVPSAVAYFWPRRRSGHGHLNSDEIRKLAEQVSRPLASTLEEQLRGAAESAAESLEAQARMAERLETATRRIESAVADLMNRRDDASKHALERLQVRDTGAAKQLFEGILKTKLNEGEASRKEAADAARNLAALTRVEKVEDAAAKAAALYRQAAGLNPENIDNWIDLGDVAMEAADLAEAARGRDLDEARRAYEEASGRAEQRQDQPRLKTARERLVDVLGKIAQLRKMRRLAQAREAGPVASLDQLVGARAQARAEERARSVETELSKEPDERSQLAVARLKDGDTAPAKEIFDGILTAKASEGAAGAKYAARAASNLAALTRSDDVENAKKLYARAAELDPENVDYWVDLRDVSLEAGDLTEARLALKRVTELDLGNMDNWIVLIRAYRRAAERDRENVDNWIDLGEVSIEAADLAEAARGRDLDEARRAYEEASGRAERRQDQPRLKAAQLTVARERLGDVLDKIGDDQRAQGKLTDALETYRKSLKNREILALADRTNNHWQGERAVTCEKIGDVLVAQTNPLDALSSYRDQAIANGLSEGDPGKAAWRRHRPVSHSRVGGSVLVEGKLAEALEEYRRSLENRKSASGGENYNHLRDVAALHEKIGDVLVGQGKLAEAEKAFRESITIPEAIAAGQPVNGRWQLIRAASHDKLGDLLLAQSGVYTALPKTARDAAMDEALGSYQTALELRMSFRENGSDADRRAVARSHENMGDARRARRNLGLALESYIAARTILAPLAAKPTIEAWQRDLSSLEEKIGDMMLYEKELAEAQKAYCNSLLIREGLAQTKPDDTRSQRDLARTLELVGDVLERLDKGTEAQKTWVRAHDIYDKLFERSGHVQDQLFLVEPLRRIGRLKGQGGLEELDKARAILLPMDQLDPVQKGWIDEIDRQIAELKKLQK